MGAVTALLYSQRDPSIAGVVRTTRLLASPPYMHYQFELTWHRIRHMTLRPGTVALLALLLPLLTQLISARYHGFHVCCEPDRHEPADMLSTHAWSLNQLGV